MAFRGRAPARRGLLRRLPPDPGSWHRRYSPAGAACIRGAGAHRGRVSPGLPPGYLGRQRP
eukprot:4252729-Lingulodinium_polyedra.AAC.1